MAAWQHGFDVVLFIFFILFVVFPLQEHFRLKSTLTLSDSGITSSRFKEFNANGFVPWKYIVSVKHTHFRHGTRCIDVRVNAEMLKKQRGIPDHVFYTLTKRIFVNQFEQSEKEITQLINKQVGYKGDERLKDIGSIIREISDTFT